MSMSVMEMISAARGAVELVAAPQAATEVGSAVFLDVREPEEWQLGHIDGSVPAPRGLLEFFADPASPRHKAELEPTGRVIVVCASGARASLAAATLQAMGYRNVAVLDGGIKAWTEAGFATRVHEYSGI